MRGARVLKDRLGRRAEKLRISVTDRCNLRCRYCMPAERVRWLDRKEILTFAEITRLVRIFTRLGVRRVRLTGGEPLLRRGLVQLVRSIAAVPQVESLGITTNGVLMERYLEPLYQAGVRHLNVSLDTLKPEKYRRLVRYDGLSAVLRGIRRAQQVGFHPVKVNTVALKGVNDEEILDLLEWSMREGVILRFIEYMPLDGDRRWAREEVLTEREILERITRRYRVIRVERKCSNPATRYRVQETGAEFGIIPSVTRPFCESCNRVRITAEGAFRTCLFAHEETDLKGPLRRGASDEEIARIIRAAVLEKWEGHRIGTREFQAPARTMHAIGG